MSLIKELLEITILKEEAAATTGGGSIASNIGNLFTGKTLKRNFSGYRRLKEDVASEFDPAEVKAKVINASKQADNEEDDDLIGFALEQSNGKLVTVRVKKEQAEEFEKKLSARLEELEEYDDDVSHDDIAELIYSLRNEFDIVDVKFGGVDGGGTDCCDGRDQQNTNEKQQVDTDEGENEDEPTAPETPDGDTPTEDDEEKAQESGLTQVLIDLLKTDAEAKKEQAAAEVAKYEAEKAEIDAKVALGDADEAREILDMKEYNKRKTEEKREEKTKEELEEYRHELAKKADEEAK